MTEVRIIIRKVDSGRDLEQVFEIRNQVFVVEQKVDPDLEYDGFEETSQHFLALYNDIPVGTARWRRTPNGIKLERFAVLPDYREMGIGSALVDAVLRDLPNFDNVYLHSQVQASNLYRRFGFVTEGDTFEEAGIQHFKMVLNK